MLSKLTNIMDWLKQCPEFSGLCAIMAEGNDGTNLITPFSSSGRASIEHCIDILGDYSAEIIPDPAVYEEYQVDCFRLAYSNQDDYNILAYEDVEKVCKWIEEQNVTRNFPDISEDIVRVEPKPFLPQVRFKDAESGLVGYMFTLRITYVNKMQRTSISYGE